MCNHTKARHSDSERQDQNNPSVRAHVSLRAQHRAKAHGEKQQICTLHNWHQWIQVQGGCFRSVIQRLSHFAKPHHTGNTSQIYQPCHQALSFQEEHLCTLTDCLLPHLQLQVRAYFCGTTIPSATNQDLTMYQPTFVAMWEPQHVQGQCIFQCFNPLSCCPRYMAPLFV